MEKRNLSGPLYCMAAAALYGFMPLFAKIAYAHGSNAMTVISGRFTFAFLGLAILNVLNPKQSARITRSDFRGIALIASFYTILSITLYSSYEYIDASLAATLHFSYPLFTMLIAAAVFHARLTRQQILCALICAVGILMLYTPGGSVHVIGMVLAVISALGYALYVVGLARLPLQHLSASTVCLWLSLINAIVLTAIAFLSGQLVIRDLDAVAWLATAGLGILSTVLPIIFFQRGIHKVGEVPAVLFSTLEPIVSALIGIVFFHELLTVRLIIGIVCILSASVLLTIFAPAQSAS